MSNLAAGIPIGLAIGIGSGMATGIGAGKAAGKKEVAEAIRAYAATHTIQVTGSGGTAVILEEFISAVTGPSATCTASSEGSNRTVWIIVAALLVLAGIGAGLLFFLMR